jgi:hypothetical protein
MNPFLINVLIATSIIVLIVYFVLINDILKSRLKKTDKFFWIFIVVTFNIFGAVSYYLFGKNKLNNNA